MKKITKSLGLMSLLLATLMAGGSGWAWAADPVLASLEMAPSASTILVGNTVQLTATPKDQGGNPFIGATTLFVSGNPAVATVNSSTGLVTGTSTGLAAIIGISFSGNAVVTGVSTITVTNTAKERPVISGITAPTTLDVEEEGIWKVRAYDPQDESLTYEADWGDGVLQPLSTKSLAQQSSVQTATFTHAYANSGNYKITFVVTDEDGLSATSTVTVRVGSSSINDDDDDRWDDDRDEDGSSTSFDDDEDVHEEDNDKDRHLNEDKHADEDDHSSMDNEDRHEDEDEDEDEDEHEHEDD